MEVFNMNVQLGCAHEYEMHECAIFSYYVFNEYEICSYGFFTWLAAFLNDILLYCSTVMNRLYILLIVLKSIFYFIDLIF